GNGGLAEAEGVARLLPAHPDPRLQRVALRADAEVEGVQVAPDAVLGDGPGEAVGDGLADAHRGVLGAQRGNPAVEAEGYHRVPDRALPGQIPGKHVRGEAGEVHEEGLVIFVEQAVGADGYGDGSRLHVGCDMPRATFREIVDAGAGHADPAGCSRTDGLG